MIIKSVELRQVRMPLREPFVTSYGVENDKEFVLVYVETNEVVGVGECVALSAPLYSAETYATAWYMLTRFLIPTVLGKEVVHPSEIRELFAPFRGHRMAKAALETAIWDAYAKTLSEPLFKLIGGQRTEIPVGISIGIQPTISELLNKIESYLKQGYQRFKIKITPVSGYEVLYAIRRAYPDISLMVDANSAYTLNDIPILKELDDFNLMMIEQPLAYDDLLDHAKLQQVIRTPICLDESLHSLADVKKALELGACQIVNLKIGRVGGLSEAIDIEAICRQHNIPLWCGGMLESGVGRMYNLAVSSLPGFILPGDTGPSSRYFVEDIIDPPVEFIRPGYLSVPDSIGIGTSLRIESINKFTETKEKYSM